MDSARSASVVPMRLYANWDMDRTSPSAIQRVLTMLLTRIVLQKELKGESTLIIAVRLQGHKRTLRSNDFVVPATDVTLAEVEISLDISFTIQYWHFVKRKSNVLQLLVQRRKKYKNRKIPGFKTLAVGYINLDEVLQQGGIREIRVWDPASLNKADPDIKEMHAGSITVMNCQTQAVDTDFDGAKWGKSAAKEGASDDDAEEDSTPEDSDYDMNENDYLEQTPRLEQPGDRRRKQRMQSRKKMNQKNIKQRLVALLKRFKVPDEDNAVSVGGSSGSRMRPTAQELEEIFEELERISDSGPELEPDKMSIISNPRPGLRPFFGSRTDILPAIEDRLLSEGSAIESEEQEFSSELENMAEGSGLRQDSYELPNYAPDTPSGTRPSSSRKTADGKPVPLRDLRLKHSTTIGSLSSTNDARAVATGSAGAGGMPLSNVLNRKPVDSPAPLADMVLWKLEEQPPTTSGNVWLCSTVDIPWISRVQFSQIKSVHLTDCPSLAEVRAALQSIVGSIQKFCNTNSAMPSMTIIGLLGSDRLVSHALRAYVDLLQNKSSQEWLNYLRFALLVPPSSVIGRLMAQMGDSGYAEASWRTLCKIASAYPEMDPSSEGHEENGNATMLLEECLSNALNGIHHRPMNLPIGEVMLQLSGNGSTHHAQHEHVGDERDNSQVFIPFLSEIHIGNLEEINSLYYLKNAATSSAADEAGPPLNSSPSGATTSSQSYPTFATITGGNFSPPSSPNLPKTSEGRELQIEYWTPSGHGLPSGMHEGAATKISPGSKFAMKATVRTLSIAREPTSNLMSILFVKEKKKDKVLQKLGRKTKTRTSESFHSQSRVVSSVSRMVCSGGGRGPADLEVCIDGVMWTRIRFFQVSSQWQTHVKLFPICLPPSAHSVQTIAAGASAR